MQLTGSVSGLEANPMSDSTRAAENQEGLGRKRQTTIAAAIEVAAASHASGRRHELATLRSPSNEDITRHSRSAGAASRTEFMAASCRAVRDMAA